MDSGHLVKEINFDRWQLMDHPTIRISKSRALPMFHSFTGCDTGSAFAGKRNKKLHGRFG